MRHWKIGELASATGLTVRTLHHFDEIGLLRPLARSATGHRLYTGDDVRRLYRILALRQLGMALREVGAALDGPSGALEAAVVQQLAEVERQASAHRLLHRRLTALRAAIERAAEPSIDQLIETMEAMMQTSYFTPDQLATLKQRHREAGDAGFARWKARWAELIAEVEAHISRGTDPADPAAQATARRWSELMDHLTGGDRTVVSSMYAKMDGEGPESATKNLVTAEVWTYMKRCFAVGF